MLLAEPSAGTVLILHEVDALLEMMWHLAQPTEIIMPRAHAVSMERILVLAGEKRMSDCVLNEMHEIVAAFKAEKREARKALRCKPPFPQITPGRAQRPFGFNPIAPLARSNC